MKDIKTSCHFKIHYVINKTNLILSQKKLCTHITNNYPIRCYND
jgi:hypothetical protein